MVIASRQGREAVKPLTPVSLDAFSDEDRKRFRVSASRIVLRILREIETKRIPVHVFSDDLKKWYVTEILDVNELKSQLVFRAPFEHALSEDFRQYSRLIVTTIVDSIRMQFYVDDAQFVTHGGRRALATSSPVNFYRLQRRDSVRLRASGGSTINCEVTYPGASGKPVRRAFPVYDISIGGLSLFNAPITKIGLEIEGARFTLPEAGLVTVDLVVRNIIKTKAKDGTVVQRVGCQFVDLPTAMENKIQRYLLRLDHAQKGTLGN